MMAMASNGTRDNCAIQNLLKKSGAQTREFYFHIKGGNHLSITRADADQQWKDCIPAVTVTSPCKVYHTIQCTKENFIVHNIRKITQTTTFQSERCINAGEICNLKDNLKKYIKEVETRQSDLSFRFEARYCKGKLVQLEEDIRFGRLFFTHPEDQTELNPVTTDILKGMSFTKEFVMRLVDCDIEVFKREQCSEVKENPSTYKIRFTQNDGGLNGGEFHAVSYIEEKHSSFYLVSTHKSFGHTADIKIDIIRPGRKYDFRVVSGVQNYNEKKVPECVRVTAEKIAKSMTSSASSFDPKEIRLQMVGENFQVEYIREKQTREYKWKKDPRWIFVEHDIRYHKYTEKNCRILKRDRQFHPVPITFNQRDCLKEVELWSKVHSKPDTTSKRWTTEELLASNYFDEFVGTCFDIAGLLDGTSAPTPTN